MLLEKMLNLLTVTEEFETRFSSHLSNDVMMEW